jgi:hypothetical protein
MIHNIPRDSQNYGKQFWENILQLMENSAQDYPPFLSQEGQLWYDSLNRILKISKKDEYGLQDWYPVGRDTPIDLTKYVNTLYENTIQDLKLIDDMAGDTVYSGDNKNSNYAVTKKYVDNWNGGIKNIRTKKYDYTLFPNGYMIIRGFSKGDIVLPKVMNDTNYSVTITNDNNAELYKVTNKTVNGFTVNADNWMMCGFLTNYKPIIVEPIAGGKFFVSGGLVSDISVPNQVSKIYIEDDISEFVGYGEYDNNAAVFIKANRGSFDALAIPSDTRVIIYSDINFTGSVVLDIIGPKIVYNHIWVDAGADYESEYTRIFTDTKLQAEFPVSNRYKSKINMRSWGSGSCQVILAQPTEISADIGIIK